MPAAVVSREKMFCIQSAKYSRKIVPEFKIRENTSFNYREEQRRGGGQAQKFGSQRGSKPGMTVSADYRQ
jgi:hypothetical protein